MSHVWKSPDGHDYVIAAKGAPEAIADLCHFDEPERADAGRATSARWPRRACGCWGSPRPASDEQDLPGEQHDFDFEFLGLVGLADPVRPTVPSAVEECYTAGIRVVMITGDYPGTAQNIARQIGLETAGRGHHRPGARRDERRGAPARGSAKVNVFARVVPEQKLRLVDALKANGEIVAMTGDGVNDAPALKAAHIGIAMGGRGTDVAREAAALVLLDDDFSSIVQAVRLGRRIFDNLKKAMTYILAIHVPIAGHVADSRCCFEVAAGPAAGAHRVPGADHRPGLLDRLRGGAGGGRRDEAAAPRAPGSRSSAGGRSA